MEVNFYLSLSSPKADCEVRITVVHLGGNSSEHRYRSGEVGPGMEGDRECIVENVTRVGNCRLIPGGDSGDQCETLTGYHWVT